MKKLLIAIFLINSILSFSQGEANNWFFGINAGIDFNGGTTTSVSGSMRTTEGCASFSDKNGDLLFYTDGRTVWDKNHDFMPNGLGTLKGHSSSTQSAIIVPHPGNENLYLIFTVGANVNDDGEFGLHCYTVDMTKGSFGDVVVGSKISLSGALSEYWTEKVTSVKGKECNTYWVISLVDNTFYSYKIDLTGLNTTPIKSQVSYQSLDRRGYLKVSPDGKKIASATFTQYYDREANQNVIGPGKLHLYDFNDSTGEVSSNGIELIENPRSYGAPYGVEFSPNSTKLYTATFDGQTNRLFQYDLENADIGVSRYLVKSQIGYRGGLQLAPNGKIYAAVPESYNIGTRYLNAINEPDELNDNCDFESNAIDLGNNLAMQGLPPFISSLLLPIEIIDEATNQNITNQTLKLCVGSDYNFNTESLSGNAVYTWKYNDEIMIGENSSNLSFSNIQLNETGFYEVNVKIVDDCGIPKTYIGSFNIEVYDPPSTINTVIYDQCDIDEDPTDRTTNFNLDSKIPEIINGEQNLKVVFFETENDLNINNSITNSLDYQAKNLTEIIIKLTNEESGCFVIGKMILNVYPTSLDKYNDIYTCEIDLSENDPAATKSIGSGDGTFDFEIIRQSIHSIFSNDPSLEIEFYRNTNDSQLQNNKISGVNIFSNMEIFVRVSNKETKNCLSSGKFNLVINEIRIPNGDENPVYLCVNNPRDNPQPFTKELVAGNNSPNETYQWHLNNNAILNATNSSYFASEGGIYRIEVTRMYENSLTDSSDNSICKGFNTYIVEESNIAVISQNDISIVDDSSNNSITISNSKLGLGDYEFALNEPNGFYQDEPYFDNIEPGIHTVFVRDKFKCGTASIEVSVLGFPKFFTPNYDGSNDFWKVSGVSSDYYSKATVNIFDRYGKFLAQLELNDQGWNGIYNGELLPATDYWFSVELIDNKGIIRNRKGHFSLIR